MPLLESFNTIIFTSFHLSTRFQCKTTVRKVNIEPVNGDVYEVVLNNARIIPACLLIVGVGIVPNTKFLPSLPKLG